MMRCLVIAAILFAGLANIARAQGTSALSDFVVPSGEMLVMAFIGVAGGPAPGGGIWDRYQWGPTGQNRPGGASHGSIAEGDAALASDLSIAAIRCDSATRCQLRALSGGVGFATYFEDPPALYDDGTWYWQDATEVISVAAADISDSRVGGGFMDFNSSDGNDTGAFAAKMWTLVDGDRFLFAFTRPAPVTDNCNIYLGDNNLREPGDLRIGALTPIRAYLGSLLVCGDAP